MKTVKCMAANDSGYYCGDNDNFIFSSTHEELNLVQDQRNADLFFDSLLKIMEAF